VKSEQDLSAVAPFAKPLATPLAWWLAFLLCLSLTINFIDRLVLATIAPSLFTVFRLTATEYSYIVFAFTLGMTLGQIPAGIFIDRVGVSKGLAGIFAGWSFSNMAQSVAQSVASFSGLRFLMGMFECGNYSAGVKTVGEIFPADQSALALGIFNSGSLLGSVVAPPLVVYIAHRFGWRSAFLLPSVAGLVWIPFWLQASRSARRLALPKQDSAGTENVSIMRLLRLRQSWGVILMRALSGPLSQFYWYWLPLYFVRGRGLSMGRMAGLASLSYLVGGVGQVGGGYISGLLIRWGWDVDRARKATFTLGTALAAVGTLLAPISRSSFDAALVAGMGIFGVNVMSNHVIAVITDVFPDRTLARVTGLTGVGEGVIDMAMALFTGIVVDRFSWFPVFAAAAIMPFGALASIFLLVRKCRRLTPEELQA
jgi:ACS family hexuronate transporter-like MFS transporter